MADRKRLTALKALDLLQNIREDDYDEETDTESCKDAYDSLEDNFDKLESEFLSDRESLASESSNFYISDFADTETNSETYCNYISFTKLSWPGDNKGTFRSSSQAVTCPSVYHTRRRHHTVSLIAERQALIAERQAGKL